MRQGERAFQNLAGIVEQIQVECARGVGHGTSAPELCFDLMQKCHESNGLEICLDRGDGVDESRSAGVGPGRVFVKGRDSGDFDIGAGNTSQRRLQSLGGPARFGRNICA